MKKGNVICFLKNVEVLKHKLSDAKIDAKTVRQ